MLFREKMVSMLRELGRLDLLFAAAPADSGALAQVFWATSSPPQPSVVCVVPPHFFILFRFSDLTAS